MTNAHDAKAMEILVKALTYDMDIGAEIIATALRDCEREALDRAAKHLDVNEILDKVSDEELIDEVRERKLSLELAGEGYRLDRVIDDLKDVVYEINLGRKDWALKMIEKMIDQIEEADRVVSNQLTATPLEKIGKAG
jgi:prephenate dehydrogenase